MIIPSRKPQQTAFSDEGSPLHTQTDRQLHNLALDEEIDAADKIGTAEEPAERLRPESDDFSGFGSRNSVHTAINAGKGQTNQAVLESLAG